MHKKNSTQMDSDTTSDHSYYTSARLAEGIAQSIDEGDSRAAMAQIIILANWLVKVCFDPLKVETIATQVQEQIFRYMPEFTESLEDFVAKKLREFNQGGALNGN